MGSDRPEPLVPAEVDLRDYDYIPFYGDRLFNSDTWALCDPEQKVAALRLWWRAWHEEPASSLPDNDRLLAERAGYGIAVKAFLAIKENVMRGWISCSDGRLYHPVVAAIALDVWDKKRKKTAENTADRERKRRKRLADIAAETTKNPADMLPDTNKIPAGHPGGIRLKKKEKLLESFLEIKNPKPAPARGNGTDPDQTETRRARVKAGRKDEKLDGCADADIGVKQPQPDTPKRSSTTRRTNFATIERARSATPVISHGKAALMQKCARYLPPEAVGEFWAAMMGPDAQAVLDRTAEAMRASGWEDRG